MVVNFDAGELSTRDGLRVLLRSTVLPDARADVVVVHGLGEHSGRYLHVAEMLAGSRFRACLWDLRGHGRSEGRRGGLRRYGDLLDDLAQVVEHYRRAERPLFIYAHSAGAQLAINYLLRDAPALVGVVIASPFFRLGFRPSWRKLLLAQLALRIWPGFTQTTGLDLARLSRDEDFLRAMPDLHLVHRKISAGLYAALIEGGERALSDAPRFTTPFLLLHGDADVVTDPQASRDFFENAAASDKTLRIYAGGRHELHNDTDREGVFADVAAWLDARLLGASKIRATSEENRCQSPQISAH